jgi:hypothetical protein
MWGEFLSMTSPDRSEARRVLREVIYLAHEGGYEGPGENWDSASAPTLDRVLETGAHIPVLKSDRFARPFFWHIRFPDMATISPGAGSGPEYEKDMEDMEAEVAALGEQLAEAEDPLAYLQQFLT